VRLFSGGYGNADNFKAGGGMTLLFLMVVVPMFYFSIYEPQNKGLQ
jgi:preprotein translocase subunit YajC